MNSVLPEAHGTFYEIHRMRVEVPNWLEKKNENTLIDVLKKKFLGPSHPTFIFWEGRKKKIYIYIYIISLSITRALFNIFKITLLIFLICLDVGYNSRIQSLSRASSQQLLKICTGIIFMRYSKTYA